MKQGVFVSIGIRAMTLSASAFGQSAVVDGGFDTQAVEVPEYCYNASCPAGPWSLSGGAGFIHEGNGAWPAPVPVTRSYVAFLQGPNNEIRQDFRVQASGSYVVVYWLASRVPNPGGNQTVRVRVAGQTLAFDTLTSGQPFSRHVSAPIVLAADVAYSLQLTGEQASGDNTAFVDSVAVVPSGSTTSYRYDAHGRLVGVSHSGGTSSGVTSTYTFDTAGNRTRVTISGVN